MTILADVLAFTWWSSYLTTGRIYDGKHGITFVGESAAGHLIGITLAALACSYCLFKSIFTEQIVRDTVPSSGRASPAA